MTDSILLKLNNDLDEIHAYFRALDCWQVDDDSNSESWKTPSDQNGHHTFRILKTPLEYKIVGCSPSHSAEVGADYDINNHGNAGKSFSNCVMARENIDAKELARRYADKYGDKKPSSLTVRQTQARAKPKPERDYQFPYKIRLDEDSLYIEYIKPDLPGVVKQGERLIQDDRMPNVYIGKLTGTDTEGNALIEHFVFRYDTADRNPASLTYRVKSKVKDKGFWQYSFNSDSGTFTVGSVKNKRLFNEQSVQGAHSVFYVEGEKCAYHLYRFFLKHEINGVGVVTSGSSDELNADIVREALGGKTAYILPDNDVAGYKHAADVRKVLLGTGSAVQVWKWSDGTKVKDDISDFLAKYSDRLQVDDLPSFSQSLETLGAGSWTDGTFLSDYEKKEDKDSDEELVPLLTDYELYEAEYPDPVYLVPGLLEKGDVALVSGARGIGKTFVSLSIITATTQQRSFLNRFDVAEKPFNCIYINGEMKQRKLMERLKLMGYLPTGRLLTLDWKEMREKYGSTINLAEDVWQTRLEKYVKRYEADLVIIDPLINLYVPSGNVTGNQVEYARPLNLLMLKLKALDCSLIIFAHEGTQPGRPRGTSGIEDAPDVSISLTKPENKQTKGVEFTFTLTKDRNGECVDQFTAWLEGGKWNSSSEADRREKAKNEHDNQCNWVRSQFKEGRTPAQIWSDVQSGTLKESDVPNLKEMTALYKSEMPGMLREMLNDAQSLPVLLERFEPAIVRKAYLLNNSRRQGEACVDLLNVGQAPDAILKTFHELNGKDADDPEPFNAELEKRERERDAELYKEYILLLYQGKGKDYFDKFKKFQKFTYTKVRQDLTRSHFTEKNAELIPMTLQQADAPLCLVWLPIEEHKGYSPCVPNFDEVEMCRIYIGVGATDKERKRRLEALRGIRQEEAWRKRISNLAKEFKIELDKRKPGVKSGKTA